MNVFTKWHPLHLSIKNTGIYEGMVWFIAILITCLALFFILSAETKLDISIPTSLEKDGFIVLRDATLKDAITNLPKDYVVLPYKYTIYGCSLSTFHRDVTSSPYIYNTRHPVYTFIQYNDIVRNPDDNTPETSIDLLSVCPGSHKTTPFLYSSPLSISVTPNSAGIKRGSKSANTCVLFHCDLVHAGAIRDFPERRPNENRNLLERRPKGDSNENRNLPKRRPKGDSNENRMVEQYKIAHVDDLPKLQHLFHIDMVKRGNCDISYTYELFTRKMSWIFSHIFNHHFTPYLQNRPDNHMGKMLLSLYGRDFYNKDK